MTSPVEGVAVIGMYGRFPGAPDLATFWRNLVSGVESLDFFTDAELISAGVDPASLEAPDLVKAGRALEGISEFDAAFFGYTPREAALMDPQQRLFLQGAWAALEDAGHSSDTNRGLVGVYAALSMNTYLLNNLVPARGTRLQPHDLLVLLGSDKDFLTTRVSYHLDLRGPSFAVQCGCSSSLVAVAQAFFALLDHQCDMALAGGASVVVPQKRGYSYDPDGILSPDGHCRPFDARAKGTSFGSGLGIVVLKRLEDALADGDCIRAVIRGAAVNNDGAGKIGYTAPSPDGQAQVIAMAQAFARVRPRTVTYVEAHGTATALGDPIEVAALAEAFGPPESGDAPCALGSVKGNIGHLDVASGVAGLIKTVLALEHRQIPPSLNFEQPNPRIDLEAGGFFVNTELRDWQTDGSPRRSGVSSFGIGGTNAHLVLEEAPTSTASPSDRPRQLLTLSARSRATLQAMSGQLADHLEARPELELADVTYTLQVGRRAFEHRRALVCADRAEAIRLLRAPLEDDPRTGGPRAPAFLFPGAVTSRPGSARALARGEPTLRAGIDDCCERLRAHLDRDLRELLLGEAEVDDDEWTLLSQPALFVLEYSLARLWLEWGVEPAVMFGRDVGGLVAACLAGVFQLDSALVLAVARGRGSQAFQAALLKVALRPPLIPLISELTGERMTPQEAMSPRYWQRQLEAPTGLEAHVAKLATRSDLLFLELGPSALPADHWPGIDVLPSMGPYGASPRVDLLAEGVGAVWERGVRVDWEAYRRHAGCRRVPLPTYPFERTRHWFAAEPTSTLGSNRLDDPERWFYAPSWKLVPRPPDAVAPEPAGSRWLLMIDPQGYWEPLATSLRAAGREVVTVRPGELFERLGSASFRIAPSSREDHDRLVTAIGPAPSTRILHLWLAAPDEPLPRATLDLGILGPYNLVDALGAGEATGNGDRMRLDVTLVTAGGHRVGGEELRPVATSALGTARVLPQDRGGVRVRLIDLELAGGTSAPPELVAEIERELTGPASEPVVALRGRHRWVPRYETLALPDPGRPACLRERGVYLITGGLGGIGRTLAEYLGRELRARLVLCGRTAPPDPDRWAELPDWRWLDELRSEGAEVLVAAADVADEGAMVRLVAAARERFGPLNGVIHAAGVAGAGLLQGEDRPPTGAALAAKVEGTLVLERVCGLEPDFMLLCSALATVLGGVGQADYCAANAFMDGFALQRRGAGGGPRVVSLGWDTWRDLGMAAKAELPEALRARQQAILRDGLTRAEGVEVFRRVLASPQAHVLVSTRPLDQRLQELHDAAVAAGPGSTDELMEAGSGRSEGAASARNQEVSLDEVEETVAHLWTTLLGVEAARPDSNFFAQGGNSLLATQMLGGLLRHYPGADVSLRRFFEDPTIAGLTRAIGERFEPSAAGSSEPGDSRAPEDLRERLMTSSPEQRPVLLRGYLEGEVAAALGIERHALDGPADLSGFDETLVAAHLTWAVKRDLGLPLYPHEIRARKSLAELTSYVGAELDRLAAASTARPPSPSAADTQPTTGVRGPLQVDEGLERNPSMAFVLSAPRSGSTLLRVMLSGHPDLFCPPELFLLDNDTMLSWERDPFSEFYRDGLVRAFMALRDIDFPDARELVRELIARNATVQEVYALLQRNQRLLVDKTPTYALNKATLERAESLFDRPLHVTLVRHPFAVIDSIVRNRLDRVRRAVGDPHDLAEKYWVQTYRNLVELGDRVGDERYRVFRYEDLVREPAMVMKELCAFLDVAFDPAVLDPYGRGRMLGGPGDPHFFERGAIDPELADAWREVRLPRPLGQACVDLAARFGYELS